MRGLQRSALWLLSACSPAAAGTAPGLDAAIDASSVDAAAASEAPASGADASSAPLDAARDSAVSLVVPSAAPACGEQLDFSGGSVAPDYGSLPPLDTAGLDPEKLGRFSVFEQALTVPLVAEQRSVVGYEIAIAAGELKGTLYGPSQDGSALLPGPLPLLVGAPGFQAGYADYAGFFRHFASHGFLVLGIQTRGSSSVPEHDKEALETSQAISYMIEQSPQRAHVAAESIGVMGHSKGGKVSFFTAALDARVDIVFGWDPSNAGGPPCGAIAELAGSECNLLPVAPNCLAEQEGDPRAAGILQYMHAESFVFGVPPDPLTNPTPEHNALNFYRGAPSPASLVYFEGGHTAWLDSGGLGLLGNAEVIRITRAVQTAKLLRLFYGVTTLDRYLPGGDYLPAQGAVVRQVASK